MTRTTADVIECLARGETSVLCNQTLYDLHESDVTANSPTFWIYLCVYIFLVLFAGFMSGLTLAIMSLDATDLKVLTLAGSEKNQKYARRIIPFVNRQHLVLITLVIANSAAVEAMPIFLDRISDPFTAVLVSSTAVVIFGEVLPQAICSRFGLAMGYHLSWLVWVLIFVCFPAAWPFAFILTKVMGKDEGTFYRRKELQALVDLHGADYYGKKDGKQKEGKEAQKLADMMKERLTYDEVVVIKGALEMCNKTAKDVMIPLAKVFMLSVDAVLDEDLITEISEVGHSRVPVYSKDHSHIVGVFLTKRLMLIDPKQAIPLRVLIENNPAGKTFYPPMHIKEDMGLYALLNRFQVGLVSHMAFVTKSGGGNENHSEVIGIVTLEDVLETLLQERIYDESDVTRSDGLRRLQLAREKQLPNRRAASCLEFPIAEHLDEEAHKSDGLAVGDEAERKSAESSPCTHFPSF